MKFIHQGREVILMNILLCNLSILATIRQKGRKGKNFERVYIKKMIDKKKYSRSLKILSFPAFLPYGN
jgi:hypothetical protein